METVTEILKITLPALIVLLAAVIILSQMIKNDQNRRHHDILLQNNKVVLPIRLQAYERVILFLERISMESLLIRVNTQKMSASQLHGLLLNNIRSEFEHNLSQQVYISAKAWEVIKSARSNMVKLINNVVGEMPSTSTSMELSKNLLEKVMELDKEPTQAAIEFVKGEVAALY